MSSFIVFDVNTKPAKDGYEDLGLSVRLVFVRDTVQVVVQMLNLMGRAILTSS